MELAIYKGICLILLLKTFNVEQNKRGKIIMKVYAKLTSFEPKAQHEKWGSICIEVSKKGSVAASSKVLSDAGFDKVKKGGVVVFFPDDIGYRELRHLFGEIDGLMV